MGRMSRNHNRKYGVSLLCTFILSLLIVLSLSSAAFAQTSAVKYYGQSDEFVFTPGSNESPTDLFDGFKNVMPGDDLTQIIEIRNSSSDKTKVKIYLRSSVTDQNSKKLLDEVSLSVKKNGTTIASDTTGNNGTVFDWVSLGTFEPGETAQLSVNLSLPLSLNDEFQNSTGKITWEFKAEEYQSSGLSNEREDEENTSSSSSSSSSSSGLSNPKTGDNSRLGLYVGLLLLCSFIIIFLIKGKRKDNQN